MAKVLTIGDMLRYEVKWSWAHCDSNTCHHNEPVAHAPFAIRWGMDAPFDMIRRNLRCSKCGHKGVRLIHPSWKDSEMGWQPFPTEPRQS